MPYFIRLFNCIQILKYKIRNYFGILGSSFVEGKDEKKGLNVLGRSCVEMGKELQKLQKHKLFWAGAALLQRGGEKKTKK